MADNQKLHYFMFTANYKERNNDFALQAFYGTFNLPNRNVTKKMLKQVEEQTLEAFKQSNPEDDIYDYRLVSLSYLGEMTSEEFNA